MMNLFGLDNRIAIVTGALGLLGPTWARALLEAGASVVGIDLPGAPVSKDFKELLKEFGKCRLILRRANICDRRALLTVRNDCLSHFGLPSILVNNAGIDQPPGRVKNPYALEEIPLEVSRAIFDVNVLGLFLAAQVFGSLMVNAKCGSIINIGSLYASVSPDNRVYDHISSDPPFLKPPGYGASKAAVVNLSRYLAAAWAPSGVRVNTLSPGGVRAKQDKKFQKKFCDRVPMGRLATMTDLIGPLLFLASDSSSYVTGVNLQVDGGYTIW